jgi:hypothetical protein
MKSALVLWDLLADVRWENETYFRMKMEHFGVSLTLESSGSGRNTIWILSSSDWSVSFPPILIDGLYDLSVNGDVSRFEHDMETFIKVTTPTADEMITATTIVKCGGKWNRLGHYPCAFENTQSGFAVRRLKRPFREFTYCALFTNRWALTWNSFEKTNENIKFSGDYEMFPRDLILIRVATA